MDKFGIIGNPVKGSRSPELFAAAYKDKRQADGSEYKYDLIEEADFESAWAKFRDEYKAVNVTAPFKELAFSRMVELLKGGKGKISGPVAKIGATNLLVNTPEGVEAYNSDFTGIILSVAEAWYPGIVAEFMNTFGSGFHVKVHQFFSRNLKAKCPEQPQALIVGCGGAGRAAAVAAAELGFATVLMNRSVEKAQAIATSMPEYGFIVDPISDFKEAVKECELVIYTLPMALPEITGFSADDFATETGTPHVILEANYKNPSFDEEARFKMASADRTYVSGLNWLLYQAISGYSMMTGLEPDAQAMAKVRWQ